MNNNSEMTRPSSGNFTACGGRIYEPERYPNVLYRGKRVFFCNKSCLNAFNADPDRFMAGEIEHPLEQDPG
jgi:YHS domain-containing protein